MSEDATIPVDLYPDDAQPCSTCEEPTGNPDTFCDACSAEMDDPVVVSQNTKESTL